MPSLRWSPQPPLPISRASCVAHKPGTGSFLSVLVEPSVRKRSTAQRARISFSPEAALALICLRAAAAVIPITSGGAVVNAGAAAAILLALGVGKDVAINFSLASGLLLVMSAVAASVCGVCASVAIRRVAGRAARPASA
jgi:hypothetical protein